MFDFSKGFPEFGSPEWYQLMSMMQQMETQGGMPSQPGMIAGAGSQVQQQAPSVLGEMMSAGGLPQQGAAPPAQPTGWGDSGGGMAWGGEGDTPMWAGGTPYRPGTPEYDEWMKKMYPNGTPKQQQLAGGVAPSPSWDVPGAQAQMPQAPQMRAFGGMTSAGSSPYSSGAQPGAGFMQNMMRSF